MSRTNITIDQPTLTSEKFNNQLLQNPPKSLENTIERNPTRRRPERSQRVKCPAGRSKNKREILGSHPSGRQTSGARPSPAFRSLCCCFCCFCCCLCCFCCRFCGLLLFVVLLLLLLLSLLLLFAVVFAAVLLLFGTIYVAVCATCCCLCGLLLVFFCCCSFFFLFLLALFCFFCFVCCFCLFVLFLFALLLLLLLGRRPLNPPPLPLLTFQNVKNNFTND